MKSKLIIFSALALIFSACSTGSHVTTSWVDDIYFTPGDVPPPVLVDKTNQQERDLRTKSGERIIISEIKDNQEGSKTMSNYIFDGEDAGTYPDAQLYNLEQMDLVESDTTIYYDENEVKYVINNYFEGDDMDFSYRINRFHRPFGYDPYYYDYYGWNSWYHPYSRFGFNYGWGWNSWAWGSFGWPYYGYGYPYYNYYSPYYSSWGWGGYPYYSSFYSPYYGGYWGNVRYIDREDYRYQPRREYNTSAAYGRDGRSSGTSAFSRNQTPLKSAQSGTVDSGSDGRRSGSISGVSGGGRPAREGSASLTGENNRTHTELRRDPAESTNTRSRYTSSSAVRSSGEGSSVNNSRPSASGNNALQSPATTTRRAVTTQGTYARPVTGNIRESGVNSGYTPSYNQQRSVNRSTYNVQSTTRPSSSSEGTVTKSATRPGTTYTRPTSTNTTQTYRSTSTYNRSSVSGTTSGSSRTVAPSSRSTYSTPSRSSAPSSSGGSYSTPSRSSSSPSSGSYSSGGGSSSGSSGSRSSGGSSNSGRR